MRTFEEFEAVRRLVSEGLNSCEIARQTGIPRPTIVSWRLHPPPCFLASGTAARRRYSCPDCGHPAHDFARLPEVTYAYLLGMYLGDGCISEAVRRVYRLRISLCTDYPDIIRECIAAMELVVPKSRVGLIRHPTARVAEAYSNSRQWPCLIPQHGRGRKHLRAIVLRDGRKKSSLGIQSLFSEVSSTQTDAARSTASTVSTIRVTSSATAPRTSRGFSARRAIGLGSAGRDPARSTSR
jgi:hypothetical protein